MRLRLFILFGCLFASHVQAQIVGAQLSYDFTKSDTIGFRAQIHYTCGTQNINDTLEIEVLDNNSNGSSIFLKPYIKTIDSSAIETSCDSPCGMWFLEATYLYELDVQPFKLLQMDSLLISFSPGKRKKSNNVINSGSLPLKITAAIYNLQQGNSSYTSHFAPSFYGNRGKDYMSSPALQDQIHSPPSALEDSINCISFPLETVVGPVRYTSGYSYQQPVITSAGFHLIGNTGDLRFIPTFLDTTYHKTRINEYRNNQIIGYTEREHLIQVVASNDASHIVSGKNISTQVNPANYEMSICDLDSNYLRFIGTDGKNGDTDSVFVFTLQPNILSKSAWYDTVDFHLPFSPNRVDNAPLRIFAKVYTDPCKPWTYGSATFLVHHNYSPRTKVTTAYLGDRKIALIAKDTGQCASPKYSWKANGQPLNGDSTTFEVKYPGTYNYSLAVRTANGKCPEQLSGSHQTPLFPYVELSPGNSEICEDSHVPIIATIHNGTIAPEIVWNTGHIGPQETIHMINDTTIYATANFPSGFSNSDTINIKLLPSPDIRINQQQPHCNNNPLTLTLNRDHANLDSLLIVSWLDSTGSIIKTGDSLVFRGEGTLILRSANKKGCFGSDTLKVAFTKLPTLPQKTGELCKFDPVSLSASSSKASVAIWSFTPDDTSTISENLNFLATHDTLVYVTLRDSSDNLQCLWKSTTQITVNELPEFQKVQTSSVCRNADPIYLNDTNLVIPPNGRWTETVSSNGVLVNDTLFDPKSAKDDQVEFIYTITDPKTGCQSDTSYYFEMKQIPDVDFLKNIEPCDTSEVIELTDYAGSLGKWSGIGVYYKEDTIALYKPKTKPGKTDTLFFTAYNIHCSNTDYQVVEVSMHGKMWISIPHGVVGNYIEFEDQTHCHVDLRKWSIYLSDQVVNDTTQRFSYRFMEEGDYEVSLVVRDTIRNLYDSVSTFISIAPRVGDQQLELTETLDLYPNPAQNYLMLVASKPVESMRILNSLGQVVISPIQLHVGNNQIDVSTLKPGPYFVFIQSNGNQASKLIQIVR